MDNGAQGPDRVTPKPSPDKPPLPSFLTLPEEADVRSDRGHATAAERPSFLDVGEPEVHRPEPRSRPAAPLLPDAPPDVRADHGRPALAQRPGFLDLGTPDFRPTRPGAGPPPIHLPPPEAHVARAHAGDHPPQPIRAPSEFEVRRDHAVRTEIPPLPTDPGRVVIQPEGMRRKVRVMTTGVFDLIHLGHIHMLEAARQLGDELVVVIARDDTVRRMKHEPLNGEAVRRDIVQALRPVTKAVLGHTGDIYQSVVDVQPDIVALGFDQKFMEEEVRRRCEERGIKCRVVRLPQFDHDLDATRKIIDRIADRIQRNELYPKREA